MVGVLPDPREIPGIQIARSQRDPRNTGGEIYPSCPPSFSTFSTLSSILVHLIHLIHHPYPLYLPSLSTLSTLYTILLHLIHHPSPPSAPCPLFFPPSHATARLRVGSMSRKALKYQKYIFSKSKSVLPKMSARSGLVGYKLSWPHLELFQANINLPEVGGRGARL